MKAIVNIFLKILISIILLLYLFYFSGIVDIRAVIVTLKKTNPLLFIVVFFIGFNAVFISTKRWSLFLPEKTKYSRLVSLNFIGLFFNTFLPGRLGGEIIRTLYVYRDIGKGIISVTSVFLDKYMGISAIIGMSLIALIGGYPSFKGTALVWFVALVCIVFFVLNVVFWKVNWGKIKGMNTWYTSLMEYKRNKSPLYHGLMLSFILQLITIIEVYVLSIAIELDVPIIYFFIFVPIINALTAVPITIAGLGIREVSFTTLFSMFFIKLGVTAHQAVSLSLLLFIEMTLVNLIGGIEYLRIGKLSEKG
jgi:uncharacterized membrane protein YbhN (UPF0104 family)